MESKSVEDQWTFAAEALVSSNIVESVVFNQVALSGYKMKESLR